MKQITVIPQKIAPREICGVTHGGKSFRLTEEQAERPLQLGLVRLPQAKAIRPAKSAKPAAPEPEVSPNPTETQDPEVQIDKQDGDAGDPEQTAPETETDPDA